MDWSGVDYCDVLSDSHSDGTHSLQSIHCWDTDGETHCSRSGEETHSSYSWMIWGWLKFSHLIFGWTTNLKWKHKLFSSGALVSLTLMASRMRIALARSSSLLHARRAESRIFGSGTRSNPIRVFIPGEKEKKNHKHIHEHICFQHW